MICLLDFQWYENKKTPKERPWGLEDIEKLPPFYHHFYLETWFW